VNLIPFVLYVLAGAAHSGPPPREVEGVGRARQDVEHEGNQVHRAVGA
jgi:hypothetical protein